MIRRYFRLPYLPIFLAPLILLSPIWLFGKAMFWGTPSLQFVPWWAWSWDTLINGHLPLWNPMVGMGAPLLANYQSALFYPPTWIYFLLYLGGGLSAMVWGQAVVTALHLIWAGVGMARLAARLKLGVLAQTISGLAFSLSGYMVARAWFASINMTAAWLPWVMLFSYDALMGKSKTRWIKLSVVIGLQLLAGHAQTTWYTLILAGLWVGFWAKRRIDSETAHSQISLSGFSKFISLLRDEFYYILSIFGASLLSAVQLLPTAVYLIQSQRSDAVSYVTAMEYSYWPWRLLSLFAPNLFGNPAHGDYWGYGNYWEDANYLGLLPFILAIVVIGVIVFQKLFKSYRNRAGAKIYTYRSLALFLTAILTVSYILALGDNTVIFPWIYRHVPGFDMFKAPTRISIWAQFSLALLAGIGAQFWKRPKKRALYWTRLATMGAFAVALGSGMTWVFAGDVKVTFIRAVAMTGFWGIGAGILSLTAPKNPELKISQYWTPIVVIWILADLLFAGWGLIPGIDKVVYNVPDAKIQERVYISPTDEFILKRENYFSFKSFGLDLDWNLFQSAMLPNSNMLAGISSANNYDPILPGRYVRWMDHLGNVDGLQFERIIDLMAVNAIEYINEGDELEVSYDNRGSLESLRFVPCAIYAKNEEDAWSQVFSEDVNFDQQAVLEVEPSFSIPENCSPGVWKASYESSHPNENIVKIESDQPGWLVISDVWYPGWNAWIDDEPVPIIRANYLFRAIMVEQGNHRVTLRYQPIEFYLGAIISILSSVIIFLLYRFKNE